jgi:hypothetical protein
LWGKETAASGERVGGKGKVIWDRGVGEVLAGMAVPADVSWDQSGGDGASMQWIHRRAGDAEIYFVSNQQQDRGLRKDLRFRVKGKIPEFWHADSGVMERAPMWRPVGDGTVVPMDLEPSGSVFVVFRKAAGGVDAIVAGEPSTAGAEMQLRVDESGKARVRYSAAGRYTVHRASGAAATVDAPSMPAPITVEGAWELRFPAHWGAPEKVNLDRLMSWTDLAEAGVKYFSGTATYVKQVEIPADFLAPGRSVVLNLGRVKQIAEVRVNGKNVGVLWKPPFVVDVTGMVKAGDNVVEIGVTNFWVNRLIGDEQEPDDAEWRQGRPGSGAVFPTTASASAVARGPAGGIPLAVIPEWVKEGKARPSGGRYTFSSYKFYGKDSPLLESGLLGPVKIEAWEEVAVP